MQNSLRTIRAEFTQTTTNAMLKLPLVAEGRFFMTKPESIRWEYLRPEQMRFVIAGDEYTGYYPERRQAEQRNIQRWSERIFRFIGLGQASDELSKFYDIRLEREAAGPDGAHLLILEPKKKRVRKRIVEEVRFFVDATTFLPRRVEHTSAGGGSRVIEFHEIEVNPELSAALYRVELPPGVKVTQGFGGLPGLGADDAR